MLGNVSEWTCSEYDEGYRGAEQGCPSGSGDFRVHRGGSWIEEEWSIRSASRLRSFFYSQLHHLGFRLAQD